MKLHYYYPFILTILRMWRRYIRQAVVKYMAVCAQRAIHSVRMS